VFGRKTRLQIPGDKAPGYAPTGQQSCLETKAYSSIYLFLLSKIVLSNNSPGLA
jgi:hypothetical protein